MPIQPPTAAPPAAGAARAAPWTVTAARAARRTVTAALAARRAVTAALAVWALTAPPAHAGTPQDGADDEGPGPPPLYRELREAEVSYAGDIRGGRFRVDRFELELEEGRLYLAPEIGGLVPAAVFVGDGRLRGYPPDAVEHHQLERFSDEHQVDEAFDRLVLWTGDDAAGGLRALAVPGRERRRDTRRADRLLRNRRRRMLEERNFNPESRILHDRWRRETGTLPAGRAYRLVELDSKDHGWLTLVVEPHDPEEVALYRHEDRRGVSDTWMRFDALTDYRPEYAERALEPFPVDPDALDDDEATGAALGLPPRPVAPDREGWTPRARVPRTEVDIALDGDGDVRATAALLIEPLAPTRGLRLRISMMLEVTDIRWRPGPTDGPAGAGLLAAGAADADADRADPAAPTGEPLPFAQEREERTFEDDHFEPWVTVALPREVAAGEPFILELAYEGPLVDRLRQTRDFVLLDTLHWWPQHADNRTTRLAATFRMPDRYRVASGGALLDESVEDDTRVQRWATDGPVGSMAFHYGEFEVTEVERAEAPAISIYADPNHRGFAPDSRERTIADLTGAIDLLAEYFGPFPHPSLLVTETETTSGQAFPGLLFLSYRAFGDMHTGEAEAFRAHEVAHQWWGAGIDWWRDYRDQWMAEGFSNYAAALYALHGLDDPDQFAEMIDAWRLDVLREGQVGQGIGLRHYGFSPQALRWAEGHEAGPLAVGYRLTSTKPRIGASIDHRILIYEKGAYVLHMLRSMLLDGETGDDARFRELMRGYAAAHLGREMSTRSFEDAVSRAFGEPMDWFFDQWVYGVDVPTYRVDLDVTPVVDRPSPFVLHGRIRQEDVPDGFRMPVPIRFTFDDRPPLVRRVLVDAPEVSVELPLPARPVDIEFNAGHAVLARVR